MLHLISTAVVILLVLGYINRRRKIVHMRCMLAAFAIDVSLVLYIEGTRKAVESVARSVHPFVWFHAGVSTLVIVLYLVQIFLGWKLNSGSYGSRNTHRTVGTAFAICRGINYGTSYFISSFTSS